MDAAKRVADKQRAIFDKAIKGQQSAMQKVKMPAISELGTWKPAESALGLLQQKLDITNSQLGRQAELLQQLEKEYMKVSSAEGGDSEAAKKLDDAIQKRQSSMISLQNTALQTTKKIEQMEKESTQRKVGAEQQATARLQAEHNKQAAGQIAALQKVRQATSPTFAAVRGSATAAFAKISSAIKSTAVSALAGFRKLGSGAASILKKLSKGIASAVSALGRLGKGVRHSTAGVQSFGARLRSIVGGALIFNGISRALTAMTGYFRDAVMSSGQFRDALANLKGAAATAAAPIIQVLTPALTALANAAATVFAYIAKLFNLLTGRSVASMKANAAATNQYAQSVGAATDAAKELAEANTTLGIDELNVVQKDSSAQSGSAGSGGAAGTVEPDFTFDPQSSLLDKILESIKQGSWGQVGQLLAEKLNGTLTAIRWPSIEATARQWMNNLVSTFNGFAQALDWGQVGGSIGQGLNLVLHTVDDFFRGFDWHTLGTGLGTGLNRMVQTVDWKAVGHWVTNKLSAAFKTLHGFVATFDFAKLGSSLATAIMGAIGNVNWAAAMQSLSGIGVGLLTGLQNLIRGIDWASIGATVAEMLSTIDWGGLIGGLMQVLQDLSAGVLDGLKGISQWVMENEPVFGVATITIGAFMALWKLVDFAAWLSSVGGVAGVISAITGAWSTACTVATTVTTALGAAITFLTSPVGLVVAAITALIAIIALLVKNWDKVKKMAAAAWDYIVEVWKGACDWFNNTVVQPIANAFTALFEKVSEMAAAVWQAIVKAWQGACNWFNNTVIQPISNAFIILFGNINRVAAAVWDYIVAVWQGASTWFNGVVVQPIVGVFRGLLDSVTAVFSGIINFIAGAFAWNWSSAWNGILGIVGGVWNGITSMVKGSINTIIGFINGMISAAGGAVNGIAGALNSINVTIPKWVPGIGGKHFGLSVPTVSVPQIPMLANGGVITQPTLAMVGEYAGASRNPEIVAPESKLRDIMGESIAGLESTMSRLASAITQMNRQEFSASQPIEISLDGQVLYRAMSKIEANRGVRIGGAFADAY